MRGPRPANVSTHCRPSAFQAAWTGAQTRTQTSGREQEVPNRPRHRSKLSRGQGGIPDHWVKTGSLFDQEVGGAPEGNTNTSTWT